MTPPSRFAAPDYHQGLPREGGDRSLEPVRAHFGSAHRTFLPVEVLNYDRSRDRRRSRERPRALRPRAGEAHSVVPVSRFQRRTLAANWKLVERVERRDQGQAGERDEAAESGPGREPGKSESKAPTDGCCAYGAEHFADQAATRSVLPDGVERQCRKVERDAVEADRRPLALSAV